MSNRNYPRYGNVYTFAEIQQMDLPDTPHLGFVVDGYRRVVQESHILDEWMIEAGWANVEFRYIRTTHEMIPVFSAVDPAAVLALCDSCPDTGSYSEPGHMWDIPKGMPRQMYEEPDDVFAARLKADQATWTPAQHAVYVKSEAWHKEYQAKVNADRVARESRTPIAEIPSATDKEGS